MPTYDYRCEACDHPFEARHGMNERPRIVCPECGALGRRRIASAVGLMGASASSDPPMPDAHAHGAGGCGHCPSAGSDFPCAWNRSPAELGF
ncbi:MAG: zinc ribbon domain-containing protein [Vampirovibrionales bacterium]|nr:zinc ribbon domain-containing protein [Vampirovibrionales bacterium]